MRSPLIALLALDSVAWAGGAGYNVGSGILQHMARNNEQPASDEIFFGEGGRGWSQAMSSIGRAYVWIPSLGRCVVSEGWGPS